MKVNVVRPKVEKYRIRFEKDDPGYAACMWADILIDYDAFSITAQTDCGDYSYRWPVMRDRSFREFCLSILENEEYLLDKFSEKTVFALDESKRLLADCYAPLGSPEYKRVVDATKASNASTEEEWISELEEIRVQDPWDYVVLEYPHRAFVFVRILKNVVLPEMRKDIENA